MQYRSSVSAVTVSPASPPGAVSNARAARFRSFFGRPPTALDLEREERARQLLLLGVPRRVKRSCARVIARC